MNKKVFFGHNDLRFFYFRFKDSNYYSLSVLLITILVCVVIMVTLIIPQAVIFFSISREAEEVRLRTQVINDNINYVNNLDKSLLDSQFKIVTKALPIDKDFAGIVNVITASAARSGVSISDYNVTFEESKKDLSNSAENSEIGLTRVSIDFDIEGSKDGGEKFITELNEKIPLAEITSIRGDSFAITVGISFVYKEFPKVTFEKDQPLASIAESKKELIRKLATWQSDSLDQEVISPVGSSSAVPLF